MLAQPIAWYCQPLETEENVHHSSSQEPKNDSWNPAEETKGIPVSPELLALS